MADKLKCNKCSRVGKTSFASHFTRCGVSNGWQHVECLDGSIDPLNLMKSANINFQVRRMSCEVPASTKQIFFFTLHTLQCATGTFIRSFFVRSSCTEHSGVFVSSCALCMRRFMNKKNITCFFPFDSFVEALRARGSERQMRETAKLLISLFVVICFDESGTSVVVAHQVAPSSYFSAFFRHLLSFVCSRVRVFLLLFHISVFFFIWPINFVSSRCFIRWFGHFEPLLCSRISIFTSFFVSFLRSLLACARAYVCVSLTDSSLINSCKFWRRCRVNSRRRRRRLCVVSRKNFIFISFLDWVVANLSNFVWWRWLYDRVCLCMISSSENNIINQHLNHAWINLR